MATTMTKTFTGEAHDMMERVVSQNKLLDGNVFRNAGGEFEIFKASNEVTHLFKEAIRKVESATQEKEEPVKSAWGSEAATAKQIAFARKLASRDPALAATFGFSENFSKASVSQFIDNMLSEGV